MLDINSLASGILGALIAVFVGELVGIHRDRTRREFDSRESEKERLFLAKKEVFAEFIYLFQEEIMPLAKATDGLWTMPLAGETQAQIKPILKKTKFLASTNELRRQLDLVENFLNDQNDKTLKKDLSEFEKDIEESMRAELGLLRL